MRADWFMVGVVVSAVCHRIAPTGGANWRQLTAFVIVFSAWLAARWIDRRAAHRNTGEGR